VIIFPKLKAGNITLQEIGLLHYISRHLKDGIFDQALPTIAEAVNYSVPTCHRLLARLVANGFIKIERPSVKTKSGNTPVGYQPIQPMEWGRCFVEAKGGYEGEPIPNGMINNSSYISVLKKEGVNHYGRNSNTTLRAGGMGSAFAVLVEGAIRQVLDGIEHRRKMAEVAASHWRLPEPVKIIGRDPWIIKSGTVITLDSETACQYSLPPCCECGDDVAYISHPLGKNRVQVFPKPKCQPCAEKAQSTERQAKEEEAEREYKRQQKAGMRRQLHDGDRVTPSDIVVDGGVTRLTYLREVALAKCDCGHRVYHELERDEYGTTVSIATRCMRCMQTEVGAECAS
jgi:DNA-binding Lrp family transcriptional regulator